MLNGKIRTDLAVEAHELWKESAAETTSLPGVEASDEVHGSFKVSTVKILNEQGEKELCKPIGTYVTMELDGLIHREENSFQEAANLLASELKKLMPLKPTDSVLAVGLGNSAITPDSVGPEAADNVMVTRHLKEKMPQDFAAFRPVSSIQPGVLGTTGIESADIISSVCTRLTPNCVIAIDALASRSVDRLCRTVQIANTGIVPGSGVGNTRAELSQKTLGVPVIAIGVPTVVDAATMAADLMAKAGMTTVERDRFGDQGGMIVTPREIDKSVKDIAKLVGYGVNLALHDGLTIEDVDMFLS
jgi:spore protease